MKGRPLRGGDGLAQVGRDDRVGLASMKGRPLRGGDIDMAPAVRIDCCVPR